MINAVLFGDMSRFTVLEQGEFAWNLCKAGVDTYVKELEGAAEFEKWLRKQRSVWVQ